MVELTLLDRQTTDINAPENRHGRTPLHLAVAVRNLTLARALLQHGADTTQRDGEGRTPLALARRLKRDECSDLDRASVAAAMVELLLAHAVGESDLERVVGVGARAESEEAAGAALEHENPLRFVRGPGAK